MSDDIPNKWKCKGEYNNTSIGQNRLQARKGNKRQKKGHSIFRGQYIIMLEQLWIYMPPTPEHWNISN